MDTKCGSLYGMIVLDGVVRLPGGTCAQRALENWIAPLVHRSDVPFFSVFSGEGLVAVRAF